MGHMKHLLLTTLSVLLLATVVFNMAAQTNRVYVKDFAIKKGDVKTVNLYFDNPSYVATAMQFDIYFSKGIVPVLDNFGDVVIDRADRVPSRSFAGEGAWMNNGEYYRYVFYNNKGFEISGTQGAIFSFDVTTDDSFDTNGSTGQIDVKNIRMSNLVNTSTSVKCADSRALAHASHSWNDIFVPENEGKKCYLADAMKVMAVSSDKQGIAYAFVTNGNGQWLKLLFPDGECNLSIGETCDRSSITGTLADASVNPTIIVDSEPEKSRLLNSINQGIEMYDLTQPSTLRELQSNEVVYVRGFYFLKDGVPSMASYSGETGSGSRGTVITVNTDMCSEALEVGQPYNFKIAAVQLKVAWETPAASPAHKVTANAANAYTNYVIYPIQVQNAIVTQVSDINASKQVASVRYYNVAGQEAATPHHGVNIMVQTYTDGTTSTSKIIR